MVRTAKQSQQDNEDIAIILCEDLKKDLSVLMYYFKKS
jgi:hypothetical protein